MADELGKLLRGEPTGVEEPEDGAMAYTAPETIHGSYDALVRRIAAASNYGWHLSHTIDGLVEHIAARFAKLRAVENTIESAKCQLREAVQAADTAEAKLQAAESRVKDLESALKLANEALARVREILNGDGAWLAKWSRERHGVGTHVMHEQLRRIDRVIAPWINPAPAPERSGEAAIEAAGWSRGLGKSTPRDEGWTTPECTDWSEPTPPAPGLEAFPKAIAGASVGCAGENPTTATADASLSARLRSRRECTVPSFVIEEVEALERELTAHPPARSPSPTECPHCDRPETECTYGRGFRAARSHCAREMLDQVRHQGACNTQDEDLLRWAFTVEAISERLLAADERIHELECSSSPDAVAKVIGEMRELVRRIAEEIRAWAAPDAFGARWSGPPAGTLERWATELAAVVGAKEGPSAVVLKQSEAEEALDEKHAVLVRVADEALAPAPAPERSGEATQLTCAWCNRPRKVGDLFCVEHAEQYDRKTQEPTPPAPGIEALLDKIAHCIEDDGEVVDESLVAAELAITYRDIRKLAAYAKQQAVLSAPAPPESPELVALKAFELAVRQALPTDPAAYARQEWFANQVVDALESLTKALSRRAAQDRANALLAAAVGVKEGGVSAEEASTEDWSRRLWKLAQDLRSHKKIGTAARRIELLSEAMAPNMDFAKEPPAPPVPDARALHLLKELLAVIHGDGGRYCEQHGIAKASADAEAKWYARSQQRPDARALAAEMGEYLKQLADNLPESDDALGLAAEHIERWHAVLSAPAPPESPELVAAERELKEAALAWEINQREIEAGQDDFAKMEAADDALWDAAGSWAKAEREAKGGRT